MDNRAYQGWYDTNCCWGTDDVRGQPVRSVTCSFSNSDVTRLQKSQPPMKVQRTLGFPGHTHIEDHSLPGMNHLQDMILFGISESRSHSIYAWRWHVSEIGFRNDSAAKCAWYVAFPQTLQKLPSKSQEAPRVKGRSWDRRFRMFTHQHVHTQNFLVR